MSRCATLTRKGVKGDGRIVDMAYTTGGRITAPVRLVDVQNALGDSSQDVDVICVSDKINKWAKYKPYDVDQKEHITNTHRVSVNWGITDIPTWVRLSYMATFLFSTNRGGIDTKYRPECDIAKGALSTDYFNYQKPTTWFRQTDFEDYYPDAEEPIKEMSSNTIKITPAGYLRIEFGMGVTSAYALSLSDLTWPGSQQFPFGGMYFGVLMRKTSGGSTWAIIQKTSGENAHFVTMSEAQNIGMYRAEMKLDATQADFAGTWKIYPIVSSIAFDPTPTLSEQDGNKFIAPLPFHNKSITISIDYLKANIISAYGYRDLSTVATRANKYICINIQVKNNTSYAGRFTVRVKIYNSQQVEYPAYRAGSEVYVTAGQSQSVFLDIYCAQDWSRLQNGYFTASTEVTTGYGEVFTQTDAWGMTRLQEGAPTPEL